MIRALSEARLKSGRVLDLSVVEAPEPDGSAPVQALLAHKGWSYRWHIQRALGEPLDALETRFYMGWLDGEPAANIMVVEARGVGIVGHVYTCPEHRRQGIATCLMAAQMEDFGRRGGRALALGTGYDSPPYWIYHSFGFRSVEAGSGLMWHFTEASSFPRCWSAPARGVSPIRWEHWPLLNLLCAQPHGDHLRHVGRQLWGQSSFEGGFLPYKRRLEEEDASIEARVLENDAGLVVGWASVEDAPHWRGEVALLDLFVHPHADRLAGDLLASLPTPARPVLAYALANSPKEQVLAAAGFQRQVVWPDRVALPAGRAAVSQWLRRPVP